VCVCNIDRFYGSCSILGQSTWDLWWTKWHQVRFFSQYVCFPPICIMPPMLRPIFIYMLLLPEGQKNKAWGPTKKQWCFGTRRTLARKVLPSFLVFIASRTTCQLFCITCVFVYDQDVHQSGTDRQHDTSITLQSKKSRLATPSSLGPCSWCRETENLTHVHLH